MIARRIIVHGQVQGVFFRGWTVEVARSLGVKGWVRNRRGGDVEILAIGEPAAVEALIERCDKGPPAARVERLDVTETEVEPHQGFDQQPTV